MLVLTKSPDAMEKRQSSMYFNDLFDLPALLTTLVADSGSSVAAGNYDNGAILLTTGATDNNECAMYCASKIFTVADKRSIVFESLINFAEAQTNKTNLAVGMSSAFGANLLVDDGAGPASSQSGIQIYKVDGETVWRALVSIGTTQQIFKSTKTAGGTAWQRLRVEVSMAGDPAGKLAEASFFVDDLPLYDSAVTDRNKPIKAVFDYTSAAAMYGGVYLKAGGSSGQTAKVDSIGWSQTRTYGS